jgi:hypothetical protein
MRFDDVWRLSTVQALAGRLRWWSCGIQRSFRKLDLHNHVGLSWLNFIDWRVPDCVVSPNATAVSSTAGAIMPKAYRCSPGQHDFAISNDAGTMPAVHHGAQLDR